jgi:hypothetical protein
MAQPATDLPRILISFHHHEEKWRQRVISHLGLAVEKFGVLDDKRGVVPLAGTEPPLGIASAKVLIILVSPKYMASTWIANDRGSALLAELTLRGLRIFYVIVEDISVKKFPVLRANYLLQINAAPLAEAVVEKQNGVLATLAAEVIEVLEGEPWKPSESPRLVADLSRFGWSNEVGSALRRARRLATASRAIPAAVATPALLFGLAEGGRQKVDYFRTPQFLWEELVATGEEAYTNVLMEEFPGLVELGERAGRVVDSIPYEADAVTPSVVAIFELAEEIARRTLPPETTRNHGVEEFKLPQPQIHARHLLAALLVLSPATGANLYLSRIVSDEKALRRRFYNFIVKSLPDDDHEEWGSILINRKLPQIQPVVGKQEDAQRAEPFEQPAVAGFMADEWTGRDLLGIERDVSALASLVAAYKVEPPLSIGLFGDWGSGKSHFMRQMRKRVEFLSEKARESGKPQNELGYYKNIVQIEFNAWHYIEGNLWASLVDHIFANLRLSEAEPRKYAEQRRDELMQKLGVKEEIQEKINSKVQECEDELRRVNERKQQAEAELQQASTQLKGFREEVKANLKTLSVAVTFTDEEKELLKRLGIETGPTITAADVHKNYLELKRGWNSVKAKWKLFRTDKRVVRRYVLGALLVAIVIGGPVLLKLGVLPGLPTVVVSILAAVATFLGAAKPAWEQFQTSLKALEKHDQEVERERQKRITELENEVSALTKEVVAAKLESETVGKEIAKLKIDIENTSSSRILAEFIEDRAAASDYRRHLGLLALIRRDFEKLRDLFEQQRREENEGTEVDDKKKINRIVLYIDDLDRCPPDRVVQVLQAIHLLLAFPLFVVVVGVDSRWVTRSLEQSYDWLRDSEGEMSDEKKQAGMDLMDSLHDDRGATPHDYLEKIFQIPFWLRSMNDDACVEFLDGLTKDAIDQAVVAVDPQAERAEQPLPTSETKKRMAIKALDVEAPTEVARDILGTVGTALKPTIEPGGSTPLIEPNNGDQTPSSVIQDEIDLAPRSLTFSAKEIEYMKKLVPLIGRSPRAVKRFLNCYRLIKVGLTPAEFDQFVGDNGESNGYKAAMILLGVITGTPRASSFVIDELKGWNRAKEFKLETFKTALLSKPDLLKQPGAERLVKFFNTHNFGKPADALFNQLVNFGPQVSRFSFRVDRADTAGHRHAFVSLDRALNARPPRKRVEQN